MQPTVRDIIIRAFAKAKITTRIPTDREMEDGLDEFKSMFEQWASAGMFGRLTDTLQSSDYEAEPNQRVILTDGATATLPLTVDQDRAPFDLAFVEIVDRAALTVERHIYENGAWVSIHDLELDDPAPLASRGRGGLAACLAMALEEFGGEVGPVTMRQAAAFKTNLSLKLGGDAARSVPEYF